MSALSGLFDVIEHLVSTHSTWNQTLSKAEAFAKVQAAKVEHAASEAGPVVVDVGATLKSLETLSTDGPEPTIADVEKAIADSQALLKKLQGE
jgi:hypothetical protein